MMQSAIGGRPSLIKMIMPMRYFSMDIRRPRKAESNYMLNGNFPFDQNGVWALP